MMSEIYQNFGLPSIHSLTLARDNAYGVPRLYHRSSEGSEPESPTGGGGSFTVQPGRNDQHVPERPLSQTTQPSFVDFDSPYIPPRPFSQSPREQPGADYFTAAPLYPPQDGYNSARYAYSQSSSPDLTRAFDPRHATRVGQPSGSGDQNRTGLEHSQWRQGQGQARSHPPIYPGDGTTFYEGHTASTSQSAHRSATLPPLPPHTGVFDAQHSDMLPMAYAHGGSESRYPDAGDYLRSQLNIGPGEAVNLWSLPDPPAGQKPPQPLPVLIKLAIYGNSRKRLTLQEIYAALEQRFEWFREHKSESAWKNSIRHNLSLNKVFRNTARPITEPGKGSYWELDISQGEGYKRERKRRKKTASSSQSTAEDDDNSDDNDDGSTSPPATQTELNVDPQLRNEGHSVDGTRLRSNSRRTSPYLSPSPPNRLDAGSFHPHSASSSPAGSNASIPSTTTGPFAAPQPRFGQSSFGQSSVHPSFGQSSFGHRATYPPGYSQQHSSAQSAPVFGLPSIAGLYPPSAPTSAPPSVFWNGGSEQFSSFAPGSAMGSTQAQGHRLDRSNPPPFMPQMGGQGNKGA
ncbi:forkhead box protein [Pleurotus pulmonarius]|nr:forkhead box protein [Pleurotus pulmonarius]KAF4597224.1 forkhead box protein [Pleurotus pulmonarius]